MFVSFLEENEPFKKMFSKHGAALDFYTNVRCGLVHEARTKGQWTIRVCPSATQAVDTDKKVVYRDKMQGAFDQFVCWYQKELVEKGDGPLRRAFIRKFDGLCSE